MNEHFPWVTYQFIGPHVTLKSFLFNILNKKKFMHQLFLAALIYEEHLKMR
jgi:hypothetical protein